MSSFTVKIDEKKNTITITADLNNPPAPSATGRTLVVSSSHGNHRAEATYKGTPVTVGFNAYIPNPDYVPEPKK